MRVKGIKRIISSVLVLLHAWIYCGLFEVAQAGEKSSREEALQKLRAISIKSKSQTFDALKKVIKDPEIAKKFNGAKGVIEFKKTIRKGLKPYLDQQNAKFRKLKSKKELEKIQKQINTIRSNAEAVGHEDIIEIFDSLDRRPKTTLKDQVLALNGYFYNELIWEIEESIDGKKSVKDWIQSIIDEMQSKQGDQDPPDDLKEEAGWKPFDYLSAGLVVGAVVLVLLHTVGLVTWSVASIGWGVLGITVGAVLAIFLIGIIVSWVTYHTATDNDPDWDGLIPEEEEDKAKEKEEKMTEPAKELP